MPQSQTPSSEDPQPEDTPSEDIPPVPSYPEAPGPDCDLPWGYIYVHFMTATRFEEHLKVRKVAGNYNPNCYVHRTVLLKKDPNGKGKIRDEKPTFSGLVFLQGTTRQLRTFLALNFPNTYLINNCSTGQPASIPNSVMQPFMKLLEQDPQRITFLRDPFEKFAQEHVKLRVLTGILTGWEGYVVRVNRNRQLIMDFGGRAVAINDVHNEDFEIAE